MAGNPKAQTFQCIMTTTMPATVEIAGLGITDNVIGAVNTIPSSAWNSLLAGCISVAAFVQQGFNVTSVQVINSLWIDKDGYAALSFVLKTVSDPVNVDGVIAVLSATAIIIVAAILAYLGTITGGTAAVIIGVALLLGVISISGIFVAEIGQAATNLFTSPGGIVIALTLAAVVGVIAYSFASSEQGRAQIRSTTTRYGGYAEKGAVATGKLAATGAKAASGLVF